MLHQPSKYHTSPLSQFLALHTTTVNSMGSGKIEPENGVNSTHLDDISGTIGKSFTIAAILGLKKNAAATMDHNQSGKDFAVMNLSLNNHSAKNSVGLSDTFPNDNRCLIGAGANNGRLSLSFGQHFNAHHHDHPHHSSTSALQSLQHLQHQHSQSSGTVYQSRDKNQHIQKKSALKSKRVRTIFTPEQLERLESEFERQQYMVGPERLYLAHTLQLTEAQVKVWFQNRRIKWRKHHLELTQQRLAIIRQRQITNSSAAPIQTAPIDSELSVCTDSMDAKSIQEGDL